MRTFTPVGRIIREAETNEQKLQRMARASLPRCPAVYVDENESGKRCSVCGGRLLASLRIRHGRRVCEDCAAKVPRLNSGRPVSAACFGCHAPTPHRQMKMKNGNYFCKKCLKTKFDIDF